MALLVFDAPPLSAFARAGRLPLLMELVAGHDCVTTNAVLAQLRQGSNSFPTLGDVVANQWPREVKLGAPSELLAFAGCMDHFGLTERDVACATTLAWAETNSGIVITDNQVVCEVAKERGIQCRRSLSLVANGLRNRKLDDDGARDLVDDLLRAGARFPYDGATFVAFARDRGALQACPDGLDR